MTYSLKDLDNMDLHLGDCQTTVINLAVYIVDTAENMVYPIVITQTGHRRILIAHA